MMTPFLQGIIDAKSAKAMMRIVGIMPTFYPIVALDEISSEQDRIDYIAGWDEIFPKN